MTRSIKTVLATMALTAGVLGVAGPARAAFHIIPFPGSFGVWGPIDQNNGVVGYVRAQTRKDHARDRVRLNVTANVGNYFTGLVINCNTGSQSTPATLGTNTSDGDLLLVCVNNGLLLEPGVGAGPGQGTTLI